MSFATKKLDPSPQSERNDNVPLRLFFVAGESSGDMHGANLIKALREMEPDVRCEGLGGTQMAAAGMKLRYDLAGEAIMGFAEVLRSFPKIRRIFYDTAHRLEVWRPHCLVLIDYPGFNIRLARVAHDLGIPIVYYISPQVWAWKKGRIHTLAKVCTRMLVVFPFEEALYNDVGLSCVYVGHPLIDHLAELKLEGRFRDGLVIGLMPGSREQEIKRILPVMLQVARGIREKHPDARFVAPCVDVLRERQIQDAAGDFPLETAVGQMYEVLDGARFCLVASGTATVETALFKVPMVIMYRVLPATYLLAKALVNIDHIGMVNILAQDRIVPEYVQNEASADNILPTALELIDETPARAAMLEAFDALREILGGTGASKRAAAEIVDVARSASHG